MAPRGAPTLNSFIGRERDLHHVLSLLGSACPVTLIGPIGAGKSRLAMEAAAVFENADLRAAGVSVRIVDMGERAAWDRLLAAVNGGARLIVLDNCDEAPSIAGQFANFVVGRAPAIKLMATSSERLAVPGEAVWHVQPLEESAAVALFVDRARAATPRFVLTSDNTRDVQRICRELDGLPRAIELAAARIGVIGPRYVLERLDAAVRLRPAQTGEHHSPAESLGVSLARHTGRLEPVDRHFLWRLAVFPSSWDAAAASAVCALPDQEPQALRASLNRLVARSLVQTVDDRDGTDVRYALLHTVRRYALGQLDSTTWSVTQRRHATWYRQVLEAMEYGDGTADDIARLRAEQPNLEAALAWAVDATETDIALILANYLHGLWYISGRFDESREWFQQVLALPDGSPRMRTRVRNWASNHALARGDFAAALDLSNQVLREAVVDGDPVLHAIALDGFGTILLDQGQVARAQATFEEERILCHRVGLTWLQSAILPRLAAIRIETGHLTEARELAEQTVTLLGRDGNAWMQVRALHMLGRVALERAELRVAEAHLSSALGIARRIDDARGTIDVLVDAARLEYGRGDARCARDNLVAALDVCERSGEALAFVRILEAVAALRALARPEAVVRLAGAAARLRSGMGAARLPREEGRFQQSFAAALARLRPSTGQAAWDSGQTLGKEAALELARELLDFGEPPELATAPTDGASVLTPRELEIAALLSQGLTNRAIAAELLITDGTVRAHVEHILSKLGVRSRAEVAARLAASNAPPEPRLKPALT